MATYTMPIKVADATPEYLYVEVASIHCLGDSHVARAQGKGYGKSSLDQKQLTWKLPHQDDI